MAVWLTAIRFRAEPGSILDETPKKRVSLRLTCRSQLVLEIALNDVSAKIRPAAYSPLPEG